jgi:predicted transposase YdaD
VRHGLPVQNAAVLLRPEADSPRLSGSLERRLPGEAVHASFGYRVLRVWEVPVERLLAGGVGTLPLAPLGALGGMDLPGVIGRMRERLRRGRLRGQAAAVWAATFVLLRLRFTRDVARVLLREVLEMKESVTYQDIVQEGLAEGLAKGLAKGSLDEARRFLLRLGGKQFGAPDERVVSAVQAIADVQRLEELGERVLEAKSWQELLGLPAGRTRRRKNGR